ncbi:MAG: PLP-dependent aminotransferase family protein, partial [bacterium]
MPIWINDIKLIREPGAPPSYLQLADNINYLIKLGKISPGERLPSVRDVSAKIGVNRGTVLSAYRKLQERGMVEMQVGKGTVVIAGLDRKEEPESVPPSWEIHFNAKGKELSGWFPLPKKIPFSLAVPDRSLIPEAEIKEAMKRLLEKETEKILSYSLPEGDSNFKEVYAAYLRGKGMSVREDWILPTTGATQAFDLIAKGLDPGRPIFFEEPLYIGTLRSFSLWSPEKERVPLEEDGLSLEFIKGLMAQGRNPRLIVTTPDYQNPTGITLSWKKREEMAWLARKYDFLILEDAVFSDLYYEKPLPSLFSLAPERVIRVDSFSKTLAPGLRLGTIVAHPKILEFLVPLKQATDYQTSYLAQATMRELISSGFWSKHLARIQKEYRKKRDALRDSLHAIGQEAFSFFTPSGGFFFWLEIKSGIDAQELLSLA